MTAKTTTKPELTGSLEDYLETIFLLVKERQFARVKDIARIRGVKAGSVSPALRRLAELDLINYQQREYIQLTPAGEQAARRVFARHQMLTRFFKEVLQMPADLADEDACKLEHSLSDQAMDRLVKFFEFLNTCPHSPPKFLQTFHECSLIHDGKPRCEAECPAMDAADGAKAKTPRKGKKACGRSKKSQGLLHVTELASGQRGKVARISSRGKVRQRLLDMGVLPEVVIELEHAPADGEIVWIKLAGSQVVLSRNEAKTVLVTPEES